MPNPSEAIAPAMPAPRDTRIFRRHTCRFPLRGTCVAMAGVIRAAPGVIERWPGVTVGVTAQECVSLLVVIVHGDALAEPVGEPRFVDVASGNGEHRRFRLVHVRR